MVLNDEGEIGSSNVFGQRVSRKVEVVRVHRLHDRVDLLNLSVVERKRDFSFIDELLIRLAQECGDRVQ